VGVGWARGARYLGGEQRVELTPGSEVQLAEGRLRYEALTTWMGYRVFYDPTIQWLFWVTIAGGAWV
jgi:cytochrome c biogenesis protein ResB